jgi:hypothetical protein
LLTVTFSTAFVLAGHPLLVSHPRVNVPPDMYIMSKDTLPTVSLKLFGSIGVKGIEEELRTDELEPFPEELEARPEELVAVCVPELLELPDELDKTSPEGELSCPDPSPGSWSGPFPLGGSLEEDESTSAPPSSMGLLLGLLHVIKQNTMAAIAKRTLKFTIRFIYTSYVTCSHPLGKARV